MPSYLRHLQTVRILTYRQHFLLGVNCSIQSSHLSSHVQYKKTWDGKVASIVQASLLSRAESPLDQARLLSACAEHSGDWLHVPPITAVGLRLTDEIIRISVVKRIGARTCELHTFPCGKAVDARGLHGLSCRKSAAIHQRHSHLKDIIWRAVKRAQIPSRPSLGMTARDQMERHSFHGREERQLRGMSQSSTPSLNRTLVIHPVWREQRPNMQLLWRPPNIST